MQFKVLVQTDKRDESHEAVNVEEGLVESVTERRPCLDADECKGSSANHSPAIRAFGAETVTNSRPSSRVTSVVHPSNGVRNSLRDCDACSPSMEEVEVVVGDLEKSDERVVAERKENSGDEVESRKGSGTATESGNGFLVVEYAIRKGDTPRDVKRDIDDEHDGVPSARECSIVDCARDLESHVVTLLP